MKKIKTFLIGFGKMGKGLGSKDKESHYGALLSHKRKFNLLTVIDKKNERSLLTKLNNLKPNLVVISVSSKNHFKICEKLLKARFTPKIIFLEKPALQSKLELKKILKLSRYKNTKIIVNQSYRFNKNIEILKNKLKILKLGKIKKISIRYTNGFKNNGIHLIDLVYFLFGSSISFKLIKCWKNYVTTGLSKNDNFDFYMMDKKKKIILEGLSFDKKIYEVFDIDLYFEKAKISIENYLRDFYIQRIVLDKFKNKELSQKKILFKRIKNYSLISAYNEIYQFCKVNKDISNYSLNNNKKTLNTIYEIEKYA